MTTHWAAAVALLLKTPCEQKFRNAVSREDWKLRILISVGKKEFCFDKKLLWKAATDDQRTHAETLGTGSVKADYLNHKNQWIIKNYIFRAGVNFKIYSAGVQSLVGVWKERQKGQNRVPFPS